MAKFVVLAHDMTTKGKINLNNLAGEGRIDLISRVVNSTLLKSHGVREENKLFLVLQNELVISFDGGQVGGINPDERSIAGLLDRAIKQRFKDGRKVSDGVEVEEKGLENLLTDFDEDLYVLEKSGTSLPASEALKDSVFVLSDHKDFEERELALLDSAGAKRVSLGPEAVHTDHAISVVNNFIDTEGFQDYR